MSSPAPQILLIVDGSNWAHRFFHGMPLLTSNSGRPTNATTGFIRTLWKMQDRYKPAITVVTFDIGRDPERMALLPEYKANRDEPEPVAGGNGEPETEVMDAVREQIDDLRELLPASGVSVCAYDHFEADDVIATLTEEWLLTTAHGGHGHVFIATSDKDLAQLVRTSPDGSLVRMVRLDKDKVTEFDETAVYEKWGVYPHQVVDYLALVGDVSDNIPGIKGVGPKTAITWLNKHGTIEDVLAHKDELPARFHESFTREFVDRNVALVKLKNVNFPQLEIAEQNHEAVIKKMYSLQMNSLALAYKERNKLL